MTESISFDLTMSETVCVLKTIAKQISDYSPELDAREQWEEDQLESAIQKMERVYNLKSKELG